MDTAPRTTAARPQRGDELELTIDSLAYGGAGVARLDNYVVFVSGELPATGCGRLSASASGRMPRRARWGRS